MKVIVVGADWSENSERAVEMASDLAAKYDAELVAVHVITDKPFLSDERHLAEIEFADEIRRYPGAGLTAEGPEGASPKMQDVLSDHGRRDKILRSIVGEMLLKRAARAAQRKGVKLVDTVLSDGNVADKILGTAKQRKADLIVVGSRGMGAVGELFLGSVSHKVNQLSEVTVATVK